MEQLDPEKTDEAKQKQTQTEKEETKRPEWFDQRSYGGKLEHIFQALIIWLICTQLYFIGIQKNTIGGSGGSYYYWLRTFATKTGNQTYRDHALRFNFFARQVLFDGIFAHAEYMALNYHVYHASTRKIRKQWVEAFLVGAGSNSATSNRSGFYFAVLYDLMYDAKKSLSTTL